MTWIKTIPVQQIGAEHREALRQMQALYPPEYRTQVPALAEMEGPDQAGSISASHSLMPATLAHSFAAFGTMMASDLPLTRRQHEMIAATVSVLNHCFY